MEADAPADDQAPPRNWWRVAVLLFAECAAALLVVLLFTGLVLSTSYRPNQAGESMQDVHRISAGLLVCVGLAALVAAIGWTVSARRRPWSAAPASALFGAVVAASFTGYLLPWDQLALWSVTVGSDVDGVWSAAFDDGVRFVLVGGAEISPSTYRFWVIAHLGLALAAVVALVILVRQGRRRADE